MKKVKRTNNQYVHAGGIWVRDFTRPSSKFVMESETIRPSEHDLLIENEFHNHSLNLPNISNSDFRFDNVVIVSDGFDMLKKLDVLESVGRTCIIAVNGALKAWRLPKRPINFYFVNNPFPECSYFLPRSYFPTCVASSRTHKDFISSYRGTKFLYFPTPEKNYGTGKQAIYHIEDYRNPICGALNLAYRFNARKILLFCCDDSFSEQKEGSVEVANGMFAYPQHLVSKDIIDANIFWLKKAEVEVMDHSSAGEYKNAAYIEIEDIRDFLR